MDSAVKIHPQIVIYPLDSFSPFEQLPRTRLKNLKINTEPERKAVYEKKKIRDKQQTLIL